MSSPFKTVGASVEDAVRGHDAVVITIGRSSGGSLAT